MRGIGRDVTPTGVKWMTSLVASTAGQVWIEMCAGGVTKKDTDDVSDRGEISHQLVIASGAYLHKQYYNASYIV